MKPSAVSVKHTSARYVAWAHGGRVEPRIWEWARVPATREKALALATVEYTNNIDVIEPQRGVRH